MDMAGSPQLYIHQGYTYIKVYMDMAGSQQIQLYDCLVLKCIPQ